MAAQRLGDKKVRIVLGDIDPWELGKTDVHEHLLMRSPLLGGEEWDDHEKSPPAFRPRLAEMGGEDLVRRILIDNPARFLGFTPPEDG